MTDHDINPDDPDGALAKQAAQPVAWVTRATGRTIPDLTGREHVCEWQNKVRAAQPQQATDCTDPHCPCRDGDTCHYKDGPDGTKAWAAQPDAQPQQAAQPVAWQTLVRDLIEANLARSSCQAPLVARCMCVNCATARARKALAAQPQQATGMVLVPIGALEKAERRAIVYADILERQCQAMQAAVIEESHKGAAAGMRWISNTLIGPGLYPDMSEALDLSEDNPAQAWFDAKVAESEAFRAAHPGPEVPPRPDGMVLVPRELLENVKVSLADYLERAPWDTFDQASLEAVDALLAAAPKGE